MHVPDGILDNMVALGLCAVSAATVAYAARRVRPHATGQLVPLMGVLGAFVFASQLLNFPVLGGTSGHLVGGALLSILLGPWPALLTMATVILAQSLFLQDGGVIAAGANIFNIGTLTVFSGYGFFHLLAGDGVAGRRSTVAAFVAGWISLVISASACALQLALSGAIPLKVGLPAMAGYHTLIGLIEGGLTAGVLSLVLKARPDLVRRPEEARLKPADWLGASVLVAVPALILVLAGSSSLPDPLEKLLESASPETGGSILAEPSRWQDYLVRGLVFALALSAVYAASRVAHRRKRRT
jgi:cobalt/nickel transport system permease protein